MFLFLSRNFGFYSNVVFSFTLYQGILDFMTMWSLLLPSEAWVLVERWCTRIDYAYSTRETPFLFIILFYCG